MTQTKNYKILTLDDNDNHEFTDILRGKQIYFDKKISIGFISFESVNNLNFVLIVTRNYTKDIIIKFNDDKSILLLYDKR